MPTTPAVAESAESHTHDQEAITIIEPRPGWRFVDFGELWRYRELTFFLTWRDVKVRYKQTVLGLAWAVLNPLIQMLLFTVVFGRWARFREDVAVPYPVFVFAGQLPWAFVQNSLTQGGQSLVASSNMISKIYFPRMIVPVASVLTGLVDFAIASVLMAGIMVWHGVAPSGYAVLLPVFLLGMVVTSMGTALLLSALTVSYRDFRYIITFLVQIWMFASPVIYSIRKVPEDWRWVYALNPMAGIISGFRAALAGEPLHWPTISISLTSAVVLLVVGAIYFRTVERRFADIV